MFNILRDIFTAFTGISSRFKYFLSKLQHPSQIYYNIDHVWNFCTRFQVIEIYLHKCNFHSYDNYVKYG